VRAALRPSETHHGGMARMLLAVSDRSCYNLAWADARAVARQPLALPMARHLCVPV